MNQPKYPSHAAWFIEEHPRWTWHINIHTNDIALASSVAETALTAAFKMRNGDISRRGIDRLVGVLTIRELAKKGIFVRKMSHVPGD